MYFHQIEGVEFIYNNHRRTFLCRRMLNILTGEQTKEKRCSDMFQTLVISQLGIFINTRGIHESMYRLQYIFVS